jgi:hypothetical protein
MVHHPVWLILSWGPTCTAFRGKVVLDTGCVGPSRVPLWDAHCIRDFWVITDSPWYLR